MLGVVLDIEVALEFGSDGMHKCVDWAVALRCKCLSGAINIDLRGDLGMSSCGIAAQLVTHQIAARN